MPTTLGTRRGAWPCTVATVVVVVELGVVAFDEFVVDVTDDVVVVAGFFPLDNDKMTVERTGTATGFTVE